MSKTIVYVLKSKNFKPSRKNRTFSMATFGPTISPGYKKIIAKHADSQKRIMLKGTKGYTDAIQTDGLRSFE